MKRVLLCTVALLLTLAATHSKPVSACTLNFCANCTAHCSSLSEASICQFCSCQCIPPS